MKKDNSPACCCDNGCSKKQVGSVGSATPIYGLGVIGALFYFLQGVSGFGPIIIGIGKSIFWPAILMFKLLTLLHM